MAGAARVWTVGRVVICGAVWTLLAAGAPATAASVRTGPATDPTTGAADGEIG